MGQHHRILSAVLACSALALAGLASSGTAGAAPTSFVVDTLSDDPADGLTLREAIGLANSNTGADTVQFAPGVTGTITLANGAINISDSVDIIGPGSDELTIDAAGLSRVLSSSANGIDVRIDGLTLRNGVAGGNAAQGGAIRSDFGGEFSMEDVVLVDNEAKTGGAISIDGAQGDITLHNVRFENNTATNGDGGGLIIMNQLGEVDIDNSSTFVGNEALMGAGGGLNIADPLGFETVSIAVTEVRDNRAASSAGLRIVVPFALVALERSHVADNTATTTNGGIDIGAADVVMSDSQVTGNSAEERAAGTVDGSLTTDLDTVTVADNTATLTDAGLFLFDGAQVVHNSTFAGNGGTESGSGGLRSDGALSLEVIDSTITDSNATGLYVTNAADVTILRSTISNNIAGTPFEGGVFVDGATNLSIAHSTISGNGGRFAGGVTAFDVTGDVRVTWSTITGNESDLATGGIFVDQTIPFVLSNSIVWGNTSGGSASDITTQGVTATYNFVGDTTGAVFQLGSDDNTVGVNPEIGPLADNGGPTLTHLPQPGSPVINAGQPNLLFIPSVTDQRGLRRAVGRVDIGAVEVSSPVFSIWTPVNPARLADTRPTGETIDNVAEKDGKLAAGEQLRLPVADRAGVPANAVAAVVNVTAVQPEGLGFVTAHACLPTLPLAASLNYTQGVNLGNEIIVGLSGGEACFFTSEAAHLTVDLVGYVPANSGYTAIEPQRFLDTRANGVTFDGSSQGAGPAGAGGTVQTRIFARGNVPFDAQAAMLYVTAVRPDGVGFVTVHSCETGRPLASSLNHVGQINRGNEILVAAGEDPLADICVYSSASTELTVDVVGYIPAGTNFESLDTPARVLDTRAGGVTIDGLFEADGKLAAGETSTLNVAGRAGLFAQPNTVVLNVTSVAPEGTGFVTAYPCGEPFPLASSLNVVTGVNGGNEVIASPNADGEVCLFASVAMHLSVDATGSTSL